MKEATVRLRAIEPEDVDFIYDMENDVSIWGTGQNNVPYSHAFLMDYITSSRADIFADQQVRLIVENEEGERIGMADLYDFEPRHNRAELGILIARPYRRKGYASAAVRKLCEYGRNIVHLRQIYAVVAKNNTACLEMLKSIGFQGDTLLKEWLYNGREYEDAYFLQSFL